MRRHDARDMSETWSAESGILRKHKAPQDVEELLVFGYSCKLFRDDEKALSIDQGKHLIPWMGDDKVKIDRYDGRGALADLQAHEAIAHWDYNEGLTDEEKRAEQLCDEERYRSLYERAEEEELYKEEQLKRLHQEQLNVYGQVPFNYSDDNSGGVESAETSKANEAEDNEPYVPPPNLDIPINMKLPLNKKHSAIIERTASFIAQQGGQMEILLKAKQQHNPQFEFLNHDNELFAFYRHVLMAIKTGRYKYKEATAEKDKTEPAQHSEDEASYYLHPSLASNISKVDSAPALPSIPTVNYKPSADCAYSMLVNKIKGTNTTAEVKPVEKEEKPVNIEIKEKQEVVPEGDKTSCDEYTNQWNQYYSSEQYQEYYRHYYITNYGIDPLSMEYANALQKNPVLYAQEAPAPPISEPKTIENAEAAVETKPVKENKKKLHIGALAHYCNSDSDDSDSEIEVENLVPIPPEAEKLIIIKMATYVAKNGSEFEEIVKGKNDPRFNFLTPAHKYHTFYKTKLNAQLIAMGKVLTNGSEKADKDEAVEEKDKTSEESEEQKTKVIAPVSFSIKKPKEPEQITTKPALPIEESDEEEQEEQKINDKNENDDDEQQSEPEKIVNDAVQIEPVINSENQVGVVDKTEESKVKEAPAEDDMVMSLSDPELSNASTASKPASDMEVQEIIENSPKSKSEVRFNVESELIDLTDDSGAKNYFEDDVILLHENGSTAESSRKHIKQLQLDRKKRAMEFLNQLKSEHYSDDKKSSRDRKHSDRRKHESSHRHKSSKRSRRRSDSLSEETSSKVKKSKKKSRSHSRSRTHKHRKHSKSSHHESEKS